MLKKLTYLLFFSLFSFAHAELYTIKLAVYKDLSALKQEIKKLSPQLQKHTNIVHVGELYKASIHPKNNKKSLQPFLPAYRKVFPDAFISTIKQTSIKKDKKIIPTNTGTSAELYTIKLAVYKNLSALKQEIKKLSPQLQKHINIVHVGELYKASMHPKNNKKSLQPFLPAYRKVFANAFISSVKPTKIKKDKKTIPINTAISLDTKIKNHTLYLCSEGKNKDKVLIAVSFKENTVNYKPLIGKMPPISAHYTIKNNKLFLYQKGLLNSQVYSLLEKTYPKYYLISSWVGNKKLNTLRYYLTLKNAKAYLKSL